jgi:hypothetical protein
LKGSSSRPKSNAAISAGSETTPTCSSVESPALKSSISSWFCLAAALRRAASLAFAICSRRAPEELEALRSGSVVFVTVERRAAFAFAICSRSAAEELEALRVGSCRCSTPASSPRKEDVTGADVPGGELGCPNKPFKEGRDFGVLAAIVLLPGRISFDFGVARIFCNGASG